MAGRETIPGVATDDARIIAERALAEARQQGRPHAVAQALADLGAVVLRNQEATRAVPLLEEALGLARQIGDRSLESDVLLGLAQAAQGSQPARVLELLGRGLEAARTAANPHAVKLTLERIGSAYLAQGDPVQASRYFEEALNLARPLSDRHQEAMLLWYLGIASAQRNLLPQAVQQARAAIEILSELNSPEATCMADHLEQYLRNPAGSLPMPNSPSGPMVVTTWEPASLTSSAASAPTGPGFMRMAMSAARAMAQYLGSGMKRVSPEIRRQRLDVCKPCEHHTGLRCRLCGCFTGTKSWLPYEKCPVGKW